MLNIQTALLDVMNYVIKELKRLNKYVSMKYYLYIKPTTLTHSNYIPVVRFRGINC